MSLAKYTAHELQEELLRRKNQDRENRDYLETKAILAVTDPDGVWKVTTENDEEGRTTKTFGRFKGHFGELAMAYGGAAYYALSLEPSEPEPIEKTVPTHEANVCIGPLIGWGGDTRSSPGRCKAIQEWLGAGWEVTPGQTFMSVKIRKA